MGDLFGRRVLVTILLCVVLFSFSGSISAMLLPVLTGASQAAEISLLSAYQSSVGIPIIGAITMLLCPGIIIMLINTTQMELKLRVLISRIIAFACMITIFILICVVDICLLIFAVGQGMEGGTILNMTIIVILNLVGFIGYFAIVFALTLKVEFENS